jgi:glyoxylase-like metal-dependent hydrolase (beta-lactamase superfamily II)
MRHILYGLLATVVVIAGWGAFKLVPPHIQIRALEISLPTLNQVRHLRAGTTNYPQSLSFVATAQQSSSKGTVGHVGILIRWSDNRVLLIDTGMDRDTAVAHGEPMETVNDAEPMTTFGPIEEQLGHSVNDIKGIVFTHLHRDHADGVAGICAAMNFPSPIIQTVAQSKQHNYLTDGGQQLINQSVCDKSVIGNGSLIPLKDFPGVYTMSAGGHTPGSTNYVVLTNEHYWVFSGDLTNTIADIRNNNGKNWVFSYLFVPEDTALLEDWRLWLKAADDETDMTVVPAHDIDYLRTLGLEELTRGYE